MVKRKRSLPKINLELPSFLRSQSLRKKDRRSSIAAPMSTSNEASSSNLFSGPTFNQAPSSAVSTQGPALNEFLHILNSSQSTAMMSGETANATSNFASNAIDHAGFTNASQFAIPRKPVPPVRSVRTTTEIAPRLVWNPRRPWADKDVHAIVRLKLKAVYRSRGETMEGLNGTQYKDWYWTFAPEAELERRITEDIVAARERAAKLGWDEPDDFQIETFLKLH